MNFEDIRKISEKYDRDSLQVSEAYEDGGLDPLWPRFERAATNQAEDGLASFSRYGIWANTVRDNLREAINLIDQGHHKKAQALLIRAANSMSAFSDVQWLADNDQKET